MRLKVAMVKWLPRFGLRGLLIFFAVGGVLFGLIGSHRVEQIALEARCREFYSARTAGDIDRAYAMMSPHYRRETTVFEFRVDPGFDDLTRGPFPRAQWIGDQAFVYEYEPASFELYSGSVHLWERHEGAWYFTGQVEQFFD